MRRVRMLSGSLLVALAALAVAVPSFASISPPSGKAGADLIAPKQGDSARKGSATPIPGQYIVVFRDSVGRPGDVARAQARQRKGELGFVYRSAIKGYSVADLSKDDVEALRTDPRVKHVVPDREVELLDQTTPTGVERIAATENAIAEIDGEDERVDVDVAVIDSGVSNHPDLNRYKNIDCVPPEEEGPFTGCGGSASPSADHGTHVAGTIGALDNSIGVVGVAPGARIWSVRVFGDKLNGAPNSWVVGAIEWVTAHADEIEVANMSLGCLCPETPDEAEALEASTEAGVVYAVAGGNSATNAEKQAPASDPNVIAVSALADYDGKPGGEAEPLAITEPACEHTAEEDWEHSGEDDTLATFSNYGPTIDVAAPGVCILSTVPGGGYEYKRGTSMASPHAAGAAALLASQSNPEDKADVEEIRQALVEEGSLDWTDTSPDDEGREPVDLEPLLHLGDPLLTAWTGGVTEIDPTERSATLSALINPGGDETHYWFEYGATTEYGNNAPVNPAPAGTGSKIADVSQQLDGLEVGVPIHFRVVAKNSQETVYGVDRTITVGRWAEEELSDEPEQGELLDVSCAGDGECVAVGQDLTPTAPGREALVERWSDGQWTTEAVPLPEDEENEKVGEFTDLIAVSCVAQTFCMAVGNDYYGGDFAELWDGSDWQVVPLALSEGIKDIECVSATMCVAVGTHFGVEGYEDKPSVQSWDGTEWSLTESPDPTPGQPLASSLLGVSCVSVESCVAVGVAGQPGGSSGPYLKNPEKTNTLIESWDGSSWSVDSSPNLPEVANRLTGVSCSAADECMAVGSTYDYYWQEKEYEAPEIIELVDPLAVRLDSEGEGWTVEEPNEPFQDVSCTAADYCVGVGIDYPVAPLPGPSQRHDAVAGFWNGEAWTGVAPVHSGGARRTALAGVECVQLACMGVGRYIDEAALAVRLTPSDPFVETRSAIEIEPDRATVRGRVIPEGSAVTYQFEYGTTTAYGAKAPASPVGLGTGYSSTEVNQPLEGLEAATTYHYRVVATNEDGAFYGDDVSFKTGVPRFHAGPYPAQIEGQASEGLSAVFGTEGATLSCETASFEGELGETAAQLALDAEYNEGGKCDFTLGKTTVNMNSCRYLLDLGTSGPPYSGGVGVACAEEGDAIEFARLGCLVEIPAQEPVDGLSYENKGEGAGQTIELSGTAEGLSYSAAPICELIGIPESGEDATLTLGSPATLQATSEGEGAGLVVTQGGALPFGTTDPATSVEAESATLNATLNPAGLPTTYQFEYDTSEYGEGEEGHGTSVPASPKSIGSGTGYVEVSEPLEGLEAGTTYHYRVVATNEEGAFYGDDVSFQTGVPRFHAGAYPAQVDGEAEGLSAVFGSEEATLSCETASFEGELGGATAQLALDAEYNEGGKCDFTLGKTTVNMNSCRYLLDPGSSGPPYSGGVGVACAEEGDSIEFARLGCLVEIPAQEPVDGLGYENKGEGAGQTIELSGTAEGLTYTASSICELIGIPENGEDATLTLGSPATLEATSEGEGAGLFVGSG